jgi:hypothetical protein
MHLSLPSVLLLTSFSVACNGEPASKSGEAAQEELDTATTEQNPNDDLDARDLDSFREMRHTLLTQAVAPIDLALDSIHGVGLILDREAETVWGTDALFLHDPRTVCVNNDSVRDSSPPNATGGCPEGTESTSRGQLQTDHPPVAIAVQMAGGVAGILDDSGALSWVTTDPLAGAAQNHMRPMPGPAFPDITLENHRTLLVITPAEIGIANGANLWIYGHLGDLLARVEMDKDILDIAHNDAGWWTISDTTTALNGESMHDGGHSFLKTPNGLWSVSSDTLTNLDNMEETQALMDSTGPAVQWGDRTLVVTAEGISELTESGEESLWSGEAIDMHVNQAGELVILDATGSLRIYVDETSYPEDTRLHAWISTFIEKPRKQEDNIPCRGGGETIQGIVNQAKTNTVFLQDLPASTALGITPSHWSRATECEELENIEEMVERLELGALFHEAPEQCLGDLGCYEAELAEDLAVFSAPTHWVSGLGAHTELNIDWVKALQTIGAPNRFAFFGMSMRPDVDHDSDIRAKNSWPSSLNHHSGSWGTDDVNGILETTETGWLKLFPGDNIPAFNLGGCANLFLNECHPLGRGNGGELNAADIASLDLLLHRALASAHGGGLHTWNFHLPDIGVYDYTDGCTVDEGQWAGENCEAARLQHWLQDVHQRFALRGLLQWTTPGAVVLP